MVLFEKEKETNMSYFPMFIDLKGKECLVVGGGAIAFRKIQVLGEFGATVTVVAPEMISEIDTMNEIRVLKREFQMEDIKEKDLVVAATPNKKLNHRISKECREKKIPINAVDQQEDCTFIFPSYIKQGEVIGAFSSSGQSPVITQYLKEAFRPVLNEYVAELAQCLGGIREEVKQRIQPESKRKTFYENILNQSLEEGHFPEHEKLEQIIDDYSREE